MTLKKLKPTTPGQRGTVLVSKSHLWKGNPYKSLVVSRKSTGGRNNQGRITSRRMGGGAKRKYRIIDFKRDKYDISASVMAIEYDPNRTPRIALLEYDDSEKRYIIASSGMKVGDKIISSRDNNIPIKNGNAMPLSFIPDGMLVHNIELKIGKGGQMVRSAGGYARIMANESGKITLRLPSGEIRMVDERCLATIGSVSNRKHETIVIGKAGRKRRMGRRPKVRGVAMNPVDHPMGGGEGRTSGGGHPVSPWGTPAKGYRTRKKNKISNKDIVKRRKP